MRVMPYSTHRGAMLLGDAPVGSPFDVPVPQAPAGSNEHALLPRRFELTSGDSGVQEPSRFRPGAERSWMLPRITSR